MPTNIVSYAALKAAYFECLERDMRARNRIYTDLRQVDQVAGFLSLGKVAETLKQAIGWRA
ncbi:MAG: hypothetical protein ACO3BH_09830, partial [Quisquiliibacterium sp.]